MDTAIQKLLKVYDEIKAIAREAGMPVKETLECLELIRRVKSKEPLMKEEEAK